MNDLPSNERTLALLINWSRWARDCPQDPAEILYYTVSPMWKDVLPSSPSQPYDTDAAIMVEEVLSQMHKPYNPEWWILLAYYGKGMPQTEIAEKLGIAQQSVSRHRLPAARRIFAEQWSLLIRRTLE